MLFAVGVAVETNISTTVINQNQINQQHYNQQQINQQQIVAGGNSPPQGPPQAFPMTDVPPPAFPPVTDVPAATREPTAPTYHELKY